MFPLEILQQRIGKAFEEIRFPDEPVLLYDPVRYTLSLGGKRIRPLLCLAACDLFGGDIDNAIGPAIGLELFHNFTLLHDDIMDAAPLRRGKETVYKKWNTNVAILSGDTMFAIANRYMLKTRPEAIYTVADLFNKTAIEVCEGQQHDMDFEQRTDVSIPEYIEMIRLKTAVLLAASLKIGALTAGADAEKAEMIYQFGINTGIAFQIKDDWLDVFGSTEAFGKQSGGDIISAKKTFLYLKALELSGEDAPGLKAVYTSKTLADTDKVARVKEIFGNLSIDKIALAEAEKYYLSGLQSLSALGFSEEKTKVLRFLGEQMINRTS